MEWSLNLDSRKSCGNLILWKKTTLKASENWVCRYEKGKNCKGRITFFAWMKCIMVIWTVSITIYAFPETNCILPNLLEIKSCARNEDITITHGDHSSHVLSFSFLANIETCHTRMMNRVIRVWLGCWRAKSDESNYFFPAGGAGLVTLNPPSLVFSACKVYGGEM